MKVYKYWGVPEPYARWSVRQEDQELWHDEFFGESKLAGWTPLDLHPAEEDPGVPLPLGPIADVTTVDAVVSNCVWSPRARAALEPHVAPFDEFLPMRCKEADWVLFNVTRKIDALDEAASEIVYFDDPGPKVLRFVKMVFKPDMLRGELIFRIPQRGGGDIFVTDHFIDLVAEHQLTGFRFQRLWSESKGPEPLNIKDWLKPRYTGLEPRSMRESGEAPQWWKPSAKA
jgi:hypothetical protein